MRRYYIGFALAIGLIFLVIFLIIHTLTSGTPSPKQSVNITNLPSYANTDVGVRFTIDGPVAANQTHNAVIIDVNSTQATLTVTQGYNGDTIRTQSYLTGTNAYSVFLRAINFAGFTLGNNDPKLADQNGRCALGNRYIYEVVDGSGKTTMHYWSSTCGSGTFKGIPSTVRTLFINQIPDYSQLTNNLQF